MNYRIRLLREQPLTHGRTRCRNSFEVPSTSSSFETSSSTSAEHLSEARVDRTATECSRGCRRQMPTLGSGGPGALLTDGGGIGSDFAN